MRLGISTASFFNRVTTESSFEILRQIRTDTIEVFLTTFSEYEKPFVDALVARKGNLTVNSVHALSTQFEPELFSLNARVRADAENIFRKVCYAGYLLGAKFYTFHGPVKLKHKEYTMDYEKIAERINYLISISHSYGLRLSYENVHYTYFDNPDFFRKLAPMCPSLCATLDIKQAMQSGYDPYKYLAVMGDRLSTVHVCDIVKGETVLPYQGKFNFFKLLSEVDKANSNAHIFIEVYSRDYREIDEIKVAYDHLKTDLARLRGV